MSEKPSTAPSFDQWWEKDGMRIRALISDHGKGLARDAWNAALAARPSTDAVDEYERVNLREACAAIMTSGPFSALNTGDWVGQIRWRLEKFNDALRPNATAEEMIARANDRLAASTVAPTMRAEIAAIIDDYDNHGGVYPEQDHEALRESMRRIRTVIEATHAD